MENLIDLKGITFEKIYENYKSKNIKKINDLSYFLDTIETNKKYYRIGVQKNKKFKKKTNSDTEDIKNINSLVNKLTETNFEDIKEKILNHIKKEHLLPYIIENLLEKSILHHRYVLLYVSILKEINSKNKLMIITNKCEFYYNKFLNSEITCKTYEDFCKRNKNIDNIIGLSLLIAYLEKENILINYIEKIIDSFMEKIENVKDEELFKMLTCFYNISQLHYKIIPEKYILTLNKLKSTNNSKIKYKIMDILGE